MKFVFFLVALLHLVQLLVQCTDHSVSSAIIRRLEKLNNLGEEINITLVAPRVPSPRMRKKAEYCVSVFKEILLEVLINTTVPAANQNLIEEIKNDLSMLSNETEKSQECKAIAKPWSGLPFIQYIEYLRKLNRNRRSV